ncbi:hypothetical protein C7H79_16950 [Nitrosomonas supralitoralis]|uniref:Antitoxin-like ribbon-helix-helix domain-containing protein n=2 Tax=Nitrosomonas supralitoralis TaxID=2116706 RepID=A0A2P7NQU3_9PROT|nr:hypothetical protein C7H79_16950 [Nitrosomonas supralitoralis]
MNERVEPILEPKNTSSASSPHDRPSRKNTKHVGGYFSPEVSKQLRQIALDENSSVQVLLAEAIDMLFHSRHKPTITQKSVKEI